jgi:hypothetical protein
MKKRHIEWRGRRDSERLPTLIPRKLLIPRFAKSRKNDRNAGSRYTRGTRSPAVIASPRCGGESKLSTHAL